MQPDQLAFLEEMLSNAELLACVTCREDTLHTHEEVVSISDGMMELKMRCLDCLECRLWLQAD